MDKIEPFWDAEAFSEAERVKIGRPRTGRPRGVMTHRKVMKTEVLERYMRKLSVFGMPYENTFVFSIEQHSGKPTYKDFRKTLRQHQLIREFKFLDEKWVEDQLIKKAEVRDE
jgi:hypothetical protein